jgi:hypothetical protein
MFEARRLQTAERIALLLAAPPHRLRELVLPSQFFFSLLATRIAKLPLLYKYSVCLNHIRCAATGVFARRVRTQGFAHELRLSSYMPRWKVREIASKRCSEDDPVLGEIQTIIPRIPRN